MQRRNSWLSAGVLAAFLLLPSLAWSAAYRSPKIVLDVLVLAALHPQFSQTSQTIIRLIWTLLCAMMLLLEWNIFPESYGFYLGMAAAMKGSQQGIAVWATLTLLVLFIVIPLGSANGRLLRSAAPWLLVAYLSLIALKTSAWGRVHMVNARLPAPRAVQVAISDGDRFFNASIMPHGTPPSSEGALYAKLKSIPAGSLPPKVLVLVLESWAESDQDLLALIPQLEGPHAHVTGHGFTGFHGSTLPGEIRELCGAPLDLSKFSALGDKCLPMQLKKQGYATIAMHGYEGQFYYRHIIYPAIGFDEALFRNSMDGLAQCDGAFSGTCDDAVVDLAISWLDSNGRRMAYVMSLNAHEPVADSVLARGYISNSPLHRVGTKIQVVNRSLIQHAAKRLSMTLKPGEAALIYAVGDHQPPSAADASDFPPGLIPWIQLRVTAARQ